MMVAATPPAAGEEGGQAAAPDFACPTRHFRVLNPAALSDAEALSIYERIRDDIILPSDLPDGRIVMSFPHAGRICAAHIVAELGDARERLPTADQLAAEAGVAPVTHQSGRSRGGAFRWACNRRLRPAVTCFADNSRHASAWAAGLYRRARERGCDHPHALRILARAWLRVLWRAWSDRRPYDPTRHRATLAIADAAPG